MQLSINCPFCNQAFVINNIDCGCHNSKHCGRFGMDLSPKHKKILSIRFMMTYYDYLSYNIIFSKQILMYNDIEYKFKYPAPDLTSSAIKDFVLFCQTKIKTLSNFQ